MNLYKLIALFCSDEQGQDLIEYSLLISFIALAAVGLLSGSRLEIRGIWTTLTGDLTGATIAAS